MRKGPTGVYLALTVIDFGTGLAWRIREDLKTRLAELALAPSMPAAENHQLEHRAAMELQNAIHTRIAMSDGELIRWAATTNYTSKVHISALDDVPQAQVDPELESVLEDFAAEEPRSVAEGAAGASIQFKVNDKIISRLLHPAGFGLGYCLLFAARNFGTLTITSGDAEVTFNAKKEAYQMSQEGKLDLTRGFLILSQSPDTLFDIEIASLKADSEPAGRAEFPGTQIHLDVPVCFRWADREPEITAQEESEFEALYQELYGARSQTMPSAT